MVDPRMTRWLCASITSHFKVEISDANTNIKFFIEGTERLPGDEKDVVELRIDGPNYDQICKQVYRAYIEVNCLVQSTMRTGNMFNHLDVAGLVASIMFKPIVVYKYGPNTEDDSSVIGCLKLVHDNRGIERVETNNFGQIGPSTKLLQATVEAHYEIYIEI